MSLYLGRPHQLLQKLYFIPLYKSSTDDVTSQYDMKGLEELGLLKMDFLGLRNLTVIDKTLAIPVSSSSQFTLKEFKEKYWNN